MESQEEFLKNIITGINDIKEVLRSIDSQLKFLNSQPVTIRKVRLIDQPAGDKKTLGDVRIITTIDVETIGKPEYAILAQGYDMEPDILDGALILVRATALNWNNDDLCLVYLKDTNEWTVRKIRRDQTYTRVRLIGPRSEKEYMMKNVVVHGVVEDCVNDTESVIKMLYTMKKHSDGEHSSGLIY
jgi:hypothetical protein